MKRGTRWIVIWTSERGKKTHFVSYYFCFFKERQSRRLWMMMIDMKLRYAYDRISKLSGLLLSLLVQKENKMKARSLTHPSQLCIRMLCIYVTKALAIRAIITK